MDSPHILTRSQKKQLGDTEASNNILPNEENKLPSGDKTVENPIKKSLFEEHLKLHQVQSPSKRLQPSRLSKNPVIPSKITDVKANIQTDQSTTLSLNKIVENNDEPSKNIPKKIISLWKPCESPKVHKLSTIHENGKENISLEDEGSLRVESSTLLTPIREDRRSSLRIRRRSSSISPTRSISSQPRIMTRRSMRSLSESRTFPDSPSIEECTKISLKSCNKSDNSNIDNLQSNEEEPNTNTSNVTNEDKSPKSSTKVASEQKTLPNENVTNLEPLETIQENATTNVSAKDKSPKPSTKVTSEQKTLLNKNVTNLEPLKTIQENSTKNTPSVTAKDGSLKPSTKVTSEQKTLPNENVTNLEPLKTIQENSTKNTPNVTAKDGSLKPSTKVTAEQKTLPNKNVTNLEPLKTIQENSTKNTPNVTAKDGSLKPSTKVTSEQKTLPNENVTNLEPLKTIQENSTKNTPNVTAKDGSLKPSTKVTSEQKTLPNNNVTNLEPLKTIQENSTKNTPNVTAKDGSLKPSTKVTSEQKTLPNENVTNLEPLKTIHENSTKNTPNVTAKDGSLKPSTKVTSEQKTLPNKNVTNLEPLKTIQENSTKNTPNVTAKDGSLKPSTKVTSEQKTLPNENVTNLEPLKTIQENSTKNTPNVTAKDGSLKPSTKVTSEQKTLPNNNVTNLEPLKTIQENSTKNTPNVTAKDGSLKPSTKATSEQKTLPNENVTNLEPLKTIQDNSTKNTPNVTAKDGSPKPSTKATSEQKTLPNENVTNLEPLKTIQDNSTKNTPNVTAKDGSPKPSTKVTSEQKTLPNENVTNLELLKTIQESATKNTPNVTSKDGSLKPSTKVTSEKKTLPNENVTNLEPLKTIQDNSTKNTPNVTAKDGSPKPSTKVTSEQKTLPNENVTNLEPLKTVQENSTKNTPNVTSKDGGPKPSTKVSSEKKTLPNENVTNLEPIKTVQENSTKNTPNVTSKDESPKPSTKVSSEKKTLPNENVTNLEPIKTVQENSTKNTPNVTSKDESPKPLTKVTSEKKTLSNENVTNLEPLNTVQENPTKNTSYVTAKDGSPKPSIKVTADHNVTAKDESLKPSTNVTAEKKTLPHVNIDNLENQKTIQEDPTANTSNVTAKDGSPKPSTKIATEQKTLPNVNIDNLENQKTIQEDPTANTSNVTLKDKSPKPSNKVTADQKTLPNVNVKKSIVTKELKIVLTPVCNDVKLYKTTESSSSKDRNIVENSNEGLKIHSDNDNNVKKVSPKNKSEKLEDTIQKISVTTTSCDITVAENSSSKDKKVFENISSELLKKHSDNENNKNICPKQIQSNSEETIQKEVLTSSCNSSANKGQKISPNVNVKKTVVSTTNNEPSIVLVLEDSDEQTEKCENKKPATEKEVQVKTPVNPLSTDNLKNIKTIQNEGNKLDKPIEKSTQHLLKEKVVIKIKTPLRPNSGSEQYQKELTSSNTSKDKLNPNVSVETKTPQTVGKFVKSSKEIKLVSNLVVCNEKQFDKLENKMDITDKGNENILKQSKSNDDHTVIKANYTKLDDSDKKNDNSSKTSLGKKKIVISESKTIEPHLEHITSQKTLTDSKNISNKGDIQHKTNVNIVQPIHKKEISNIFSKEGNKMIMNENSNECLKHEGKVDEKLEKDDKENDQKTSLEPTEIVNEKETLDSKVGSSVSVIESNTKYVKKTDDCFNSSQRLDNVFDKTQVSVSESSENSKVTIVQLESSVYETQTNNVDYLGTHKLFCELLEDSPKKDVHNTNDTKVSNKEIKALSSIIKEQFGTEDLEQSGKQENLKISSEKLKVVENESSSDSDSNVAHVDTIEETVENDLTENNFKSIKSDKVDVEQNKEKLVNTSKNSFGINMKTILYEYSHDTDVNTNKQNEDKNEKHRNRRTRKNKVCSQAQKQNDEKVEASVETCSVILRVKNDINSSEENVAVFDNKTSKSLKRSYGELEEYNMNNVNIQQQKKKQINKKSKKNIAAKHIDDIMIIKNETAQEVKNVSLDDKNIPESINSNQRLHVESDVDKQDKKKIKIVKSQENAQSNLSQVTQNSEKISSPHTQRNFRKMMIRFKKTLKYINFTELLELLTISSKNELVKSLNLTPNEIRIMKAKIIQSTEYKNFVRTLTKEKITSDTKLSAKQKNDTLYKFNMNRPNVIGNFNQKKNQSKSNIQSEKFESSNQMNKEPELLNTGQSNVKLSKKKRRNRSKTKKNLVSSTNEPVSMKSINFNSKAEMNKGNQLENEQFQAKPKQNKPEFGKVIDQPTASSKGKLINQRQEFNQQVKKPKPKIEEKIQLRNDKESNKGSLAVKRVNISALTSSGKSVGRKLKDEGALSKVETEPKQILMQQHGNKSQNRKIQKKKNNKMAVQPTILKTAGCLFKVETSANSNTTRDQRKTKETSGFKVHTVKGGNVFNTEKTILQSNENSEDFRNSKEYKAGLKQMKKNIDTNVENNMFTFFKKPKKGGTNEKRKGPNDDGQAQKKTGIKRLPSELLEALTDEPLEKKKKDVETAESVKTSKKKKKLKLKSAILEESYIPLTTDGATQFVVARLDKEAPLTSAQQAANFRNNQLYGPFNRRVSAKQLHNTKQKYKANNKE